MSPGLNSIMYGSLHCLSFYVARCHFREVWVLVLSEFLCHLVSLGFCIGLYVLRVSMSLGLTSVLYVSLCVLSLYVTRSHFRYEWSLCCLIFYIGFVLLLFLILCYFLPQVDLFQENLFQVT
jgi:hypothetical protein